MKPVVIKIATAPLAREVIRMVHLADDRGASPKARRIWRRMARAGFNVRFEMKKG